MLVKMVICNVILPYIPSKKKIFGYLLYYVVAEENTIIK